MNVRQLAGEMAMRVGRGTSPKLRRYAIVPSYQPAERSSGVNINIGAGHWTHPDWINLDIPSDWYHGGSQGGFIPFDILKDDLPFEDASVDLAYCCAVIEHIPDSAARRLFSEVRRVLKPTGGARFGAPDAELLHEGTARGKDFWASRFIIAKYDGVSNEPDVGKWTAQDFLIREMATSRCRFSCNPTDILMPEELEGLGFEETIAKLYEGVEYRYDFPGDHINWWTYDKLGSMLQDAGLKMRRSGFCQSLFPEMRDAAYFDRSEYWMLLYADALPA